MKEDVNGKPMLLSQKERIRELLACELKIDLAYMNHHDRNRMQYHAECIERQSTEKDVSAWVHRYVENHKSDLQNDFHVLIAIDGLKSKMQDLEKQAENLGYVESFRQFTMLNESMLTRRSEKNRMRYIRESMERVFLSYQILKDYNEVCLYLKENLNNPEAWKKVARQLKNKEYRINRRLYSFDVIQNDNQLEIHNLIIKEHLNRQLDRIL